MRKINKKGEVIIHDIVDGKDVNYELKFSRSIFKLI